MRAGKIILGLVLIAVALLLIFEAVGIIEPITSIIGEITFWQVIGGIVLVSGIVTLLSAGQFWQIFVLLGFLFMIFEKNIAYICGIEGDDVINNWLVFGCSLLLSAGFMFLIPSETRKKRKNKKQNRGHFALHVNSNEMASGVVYINCEEFGNTDMERSVKNKLGSLEVNFENAASYKGGATLHLENSIGAIEVKVPKSWRVNCDDLILVLGALEVEHEEESADSPVLILEGRVKLGAVEVERV